MNIARETVLIVEDDESNRAVLRAACESVGLAVVEAATGADALRQTTARRPQVLLLDISLPDITGIEVCRRLRAAGVDIPIVMVSGHAELADVSLGLRAGADAYVCKPYQVRALLATVLEHLGRTEGGENGGDPPVQYPGRSARPPRPAGRPMTGGAPGR